MCYCTVFLRELGEEQQSKAKLTADLLVSQRKLDEERQNATWLTAPFLSFVPHRAPKVENLSRELRKVRQQAHPRCPWHLVAELRNAEPEPDQSHVRFRAPGPHQITLETSTRPRRRECGDRTGGVVPPSMFRERKLLPTGCGVFYRGAQDHIDTRILRSVLSGVPPCSWPENQDA